jgi:hypothetical protein
MFAILNRSNSKVMFYTKSFFMLGYTIIPQFAPANDIDLHVTFNTFAEANEVLKTFPATIANSCAITTYILD